MSFISGYNPNNGIISVLVSNYGDNVWKEMRKELEVEPVNFYDDYSQIKDKINDIFL